MYSDICLVTLFMSVNNLASAYKCRNDYKCTALIWWSLCFFYFVASLFEYLILFICLLAQFNVMPTPELQ